MYGHKNESKATKLLFSFLLVEQDSQFMENPPYAYILYLRLTPIVSKL